MSSTSRSIDPENQKQKGPTLSGIDAVLAKLQGGEQTFGVAVGPDLLFFRMPKDTNELDNFQKEGFKFVRSLANKEQRAKLSPQVQDALEKVGDKDDRDFMNAFCVHYWSATEMRISQAQSILLTVNPSVLQLICDSIDQQHTRGLMVLSMGGVTIEKKGSTTTSDTNAPSGQASNTGARRRTASPKTK